MPRFVARPVIVEAHQFVANAVEWPYDFRNTIDRHYATGGCDIRTDEGTRRCMNGDWVLRRPDGQFAVVKKAVFEAMFEKHVLDAEVRSRARKEPTHV